MAEPTPQPSGQEVAPGVFAPRSALRFSYARSSGPGGQNVNKVSTKVRLRIDLSALEGPLGPEAVRRLIDLAGAAVTDDRRLLIVCDESRSQRANKQTCLDRLRALIERAKKRPRVRKRTRRSAASKQKRLDAKRRRAQIKSQRRAPPRHDD